MRRPVRTILIAGVVLGMAVGGTLVANAAWLIPGEPTSVKLTTVDIPRGPEPKAVKDEGAAVVSWSRSEIAPNVPIQSYVVSRRDVAGRAPVKTFTPTTGTRFTDSDVPVGTWTWTVTPRFAKWTGDESKPSKPMAFPPPKVAATSALPAAKPEGDAPAPASTVKPKASGGDPALAPPTPMETTTSPAPVKTTTPPVVPEETEVAEPPAPVTTSAATEDKK
jgi:hypothetical protein